jgi:uncharacterized repeat protein (TIGR01451 family)
VNQRPDNTTTLHAAPRWFRYGIVVAAIAVLCSCRSPAPKYRVAEEPDAVKVASAFETMRSKVGEALASKPDPNIQLAAHEVPTHLTGRQVAQATAIPADCPIAPCGPGGCACCGPDGAHGPRDEYLCDGGDHGAQAAVVSAGNVAGLELEDAVAHYDTVDGRTVITPSNQVCIYAPRFAAVRQVVDLRALNRIDAAAGTVRETGPVLAAKDERTNAALAGIKANVNRRNLPPSLLRNREKAGSLGRDERIAATIGALAPYANLEIIRAGELVGSEQAKIARSSLAAITWAGDQAAQVLIDNRAAKAEIGVQTPGTIYLLVEPNNPKLRLVKLASTAVAQPGDEVEFTLRFDNVGDRVIGNVAILDSLTTRLEYIEGSQKCSLPADFETRPNDGSSLKLRWQIREPLEPGKGGVIQFRCRVR